MQALRAMNAHAPIPRGLPALSALGLSRLGSSSPMPPCPLASRSPSVLCTPYSEIWLNLCTFAQAEGRFAPLHGIFAACPLPPPQTRLQGPSCLSFGRLERLYLSRVGSGLRTDLASPGVYPR